MRDAPYGEVPTIVDDGMVLAQSNAILMHLAKRHGKLAGTAEEWPQVMQWLCWEMNRIGLSMPNLRYYRHLHQGAAPAAVTDWLEARARSDLDALERELRHRDWILKSGFSLCDISLSAYSHWSKQAGFEISEWPAVAAWLARIRARPGWQPAEQLMAPLAG